MARIPYRHLVLPTEPPPADLLDHCDALLAAHGDDAPLGSALEAVVRALAANRTALLPHRTVAPELTRIVKDPWRADAAALDERALVAELPQDQTVSVRVDPALRPDIATDRPLGRASLDGAVLRFRRGGGQTATVEGDPARLALLETLVEGRPRLLPAELEGTLLPKDLPALDALRIRRAEAIDALLADGLELVERAERLVCRLYRVPDELADEVVAHAHDRALKRVAAAEAGE